MASWHAHKELLLGRVLYPLLCASREEFMGMSRSRTQEKKGVLPSAHCLEFRIVRTPYIVRTVVVQRAGNSPIVLTLGGG